MSRFSLNHSSPDEALLRYQLFAYCARAECDPTHYNQLAQKAAELTEWTDVPIQAEAHGLAPLLYVHSRAAGVQLPLAVKQQLQGLYLRHRWANQVRTSVLRKILTAYNAAGIESLVLKGAALAHLIYPQPGLRPMRDLDILVRESEAVQAQCLLADLGFHAPLPNNETFTSGHHLDIATLHAEGFCISVEVHHRLFRRNYPGPTGMESLTVTPLSFLLDGEGLTAYTLGYEDMLWHLCQHMIQDVSVFASTRLIWIADIVTFAEYFVTEIDWKKVKKQYPLVFNVLSLLHFMTPLSGKLLNQAHLSVGHAPKGIGADFQGWPRSSLVSQREKGYWRILRDTFLPSAWWLRSHYGLGSAQPLLWYRWIRHPLDILGWIKQLLHERLEEFRCKKRWGNEREATSLFVGKRYD